MIKFYSKLSMTMSWGLKARSILQNIEPIASKCKWSCKFLSMLVPHHQTMTQWSHLRSFRGSCVLLLLPLLLLLLQFLYAFLQHVGPEVAFEVRQLISAGQAVLCCLFENVLRGRQKTWMTSCNLLVVSHPTYWAFACFMCVSVSTDKLANVFRLAPIHAEFYQEMRPGTQ